MGVRRVLLWVGYVFVAAVLAGFAHLFMRWWLAVPLGVLVATGFMALPVTNPYGRN